MCSHHRPYFCGACGACQREQLARWRRQLDDATTLAHSQQGARRSTPTSHACSATAAPSRSR